MNHIFISYSRKDEAFVSQITKELEGRGINVWQDILGKTAGIPYSVKWFDAIIEAIYEAKGALIFSSENWKNSQPCSKEYDMIIQTKQPVKIVEINKVGDVNALVEDIVDWNSKCIESEENKLRQWIMSGAYRIIYYKKRKLNLPKTKNLSAVLSVLNDCRYCRNYINDSFSEEENPKLFNALNKYITKVRKSALMSIFRRIGLTAFIISGMLSAYVGFQAIAAINETSGESAKHYTAMRTVNRIDEYDPVQAASLLTTPSLLNENGKQRQLVNVLSHKFPSDFISKENAKTVLNKLKGTKNGKVKVGVLNGAGIVYLSDKAGNMSRNLLIDGALSDYSFDESGNILALASEKSVYVTDVQSSLFSTKLSYNFENVSSVFIDENSVYALTEKGNIVVWDIPFFAADKSGLNIVDGTVTVDNENSPLAVFTDQKSLYICGKNGKNAKISTDSNYTISKTAVSKNGEYFAAAASDSLGNNHIMLFSYEEQKLLGDFKINAAVSDLCFDNGAKTLAAVGTSGSFICIDVESGKISETNVESVSPYTLTPYENGFLVGDVFSNLYFMNSKLNVKALGVYATSHSSPVKEMAVSGKYNTIFSATRNGNIAGGNVKTDLKNGEFNYFAPPDNIETVSTNTLAVSDDGEIVAFAYANGKISFWETSNLNLLWVSDEIGESIVSICFSSDGKYLYALGKSSAVYKVSAQIACSNILNTEKQIEVLKEKAEETYTRMYELGLTDIKPEEYDYSKTNK